MINFVTYQLKDGGWGYIHGNDLQVKYILYYIRIRGVASVISGILGIIPFPNTNIDLSDLSRNEHNNIC